MGLIWTDPLNLPEWSDDDVDARADVDAAPWAEESATRDRRAPHDHQGLAADCPTCRELLQLHRIPRERRDRGTK
jgi:hypothetical protein